MNEEERFAERQSKFQGSAKIHLKHFDFFEDSEIPAALKLDDKNVGRLMQIFKLEGCKRLEPEHHIPALIEETVLEQSLVQSGLQLGSLRDIPPVLELPDNYRLVCLHGKHRIAAANRFLLPGNKWWTVDLYLKSLWKMERIWILWAYYDNSSRRPRTSGYSI